MKSAQNEKEIRILLVMPFFYPHRGGSQKYAEEILAPMVKKHPNVRVDVLCYNTDKVEEYEDYRGFRIYRVPCWNVIPARFVLPNPFKLHQKLKGLSRNHYNFTITHIRFFDPTWWLWKYSADIGAKSIYTGHVPSHPQHQSKIVEIVSKIVDLTIAKWSLKFYDYLIFVNKASQEFFKQKLGITKETELIYIGVDTKKFTPHQKDPNRLIPKINVPIHPGAIIVTYIGRVIWTKGVHILYEAAKELQTELKGKNVYFVIGGPGELEEKLKNRAKADSLEEKVIITGNLEYKQAQALYEISDIFVNPSHHNEGLPNTLLEAGSSGCMVIATDNGATKELVIDGETGLLIPQKDKEALKEALRKGIYDAELRKNLQKNIRQKVESEFDWNHLSEQFYEFLLKA